MIEPHDDQTEDATVPARFLPAATGMLATVADLENSLTELQLLDSQQQTELIALRGKFSEPKALAREMLQRDWLTPFQVNQLLQGKGRDLTLGPYVLLERIGEGGMGAVYKARHQFMKRIVAIKLIRKDRLANPDVVQRFYREIQAAAQVQHPNIVVAYHADRLGDVHFLVMEYVEGGDLAKEMKKRGPLPIADACDYVRQAALGLQHAHEKGLVHRDIKPGNLLLSQGTIKVLDLGLARLSIAGGEHQAGELTQEGAVMGTPDYIAPEQAHESHTVDARADVYSLGCTLYFLLTGKVPFPGGTLVQKLMKHQREEPPSIQSHRPDVPAGLAEVVARMMSKRPQDRYQTAADTARALEFYCGKQAPVAIPLAGITSSPPVATVAVPLTASPPVAVAFAGDRNQGLTANAPMAVPLSGGMGDAASETVPPGSGDSSSSWTGFILRKLKLPDRPERRRWVLAGAGGGLLLLIVLILLLRTGKKPEPPKLGLEGFEAENIAATNRIKGQPKYLVGVLGEHRLRHDALRITALALDPEGKVAATTGTDGYLRLSDPETLVERKRLDLRESVTSLAFSHDGKYLAAGTTATFIRLFDIEAGKELAPLRDGHKGVISQVAFSPKDYTLLSASGDTTVGVWNAPAGKLLYTFKKHTTPVSCVAISADGRRAVSGAGEITGGKKTDCQPIVWSVESGEVVHTLEAGGSPVASLAYSPDGSVLLSLDPLKGLRWWDEDKLVRTEPLAVIVPAQLHFSPDSRHFLVYHNQAPHLTLWETASGRNMRPARLPVQGPGIFMPDNRRVLFPSDDTLRVWDVIDDKELSPTRGHTRPVTFLSLRNDNRVLFSGGLDGLRLWDLDRRTDRLIDGSKSSLFSVSPSMKFALSVSVSGPSTIINLWEVESGRLFRTLKTPAFTGNFVQFLDDKQAIFDAKDGFAIVWDVENDRELSRHQFFPQGGVVGLVSSPDGKFWLARGGSGSVVLWDREKNAKVSTWTSPISVAAFSPDNTKLYFGTPSADVGVIDLPNLEGKSGQTFFRLHRSAIQNLALSPDGKRLVTADANGHVVVWDTTIHGENKVDEWDQPVGPVTSLRFADNRHLFMGNSNGTIYILRFPPR